MPISIVGKAWTRKIRRSAPAAPARGFSLVEIMIVLVIMTLVLGLGGPRIAKDMAVLHLRTTAKKMAASFRWARSQALATGKPYNVIIDGGLQRLIITDYAAFPAGDSPPPERGMQEEPGEGDMNDRAGETRRPVLKVLELPDDIVFSRVEIADVLDTDPARESIYQMTFFPDGTSRGGEISIVDGKGRSFIIGVDFLTGIVSLEEPED